jgi:hypothetical protein
VQQGASETDRTSADHGNFDGHIYISLKEKRIVSNTPQTALRTKRQ